MKRYNYRGTNVKNFIRGEIFNKNIAEDTTKNMRNLEEKGYSAELVTRGVKSFLEEYFEKIPLDEQNLPIVGPFENIENTESFQTGRKRGMFLVENGYSEEVYYEKYLTEFEARNGENNHVKK